MSKIVSTKKTSAIFLAIMLVAGTIFTFSPSFMISDAQAFLMDNTYEQDYQQDYKSSYYPSEPSVMDDSQSVKPSQKANCDNENVNVNDLSQVQRQNQVVDSILDGADDASIAGQELSPEEAFAAINGNRDPLINAERIF